MKLTIIKYYLTCARLRHLDLNGTSISIRNVKCMAVVPVVIICDDFSIKHYFL